MQKQKANLSLIAMILGIIGLVTACMCIGIIPSIVGLVLSILALKKQCKNRGMAITGLVTSIIGIILFICLLIATSNSDTVTEQAMNSEFEIRNAELATENSEESGLEGEIEITESVENSESQVTVTEESISEGNDKSIVTEEDNANDESEASSESEVQESEARIPDDNYELSIPHSALEVHFIDVGQGDATLIKADEHYMLIDAGDNNKGTAVQLYLQKQGVEKLDYLILTHTDADHIGGADVIVNKFDIDTVFMGDFKKENNTYAELMSAFEYKGLTYSIPSVGSEYQLGNATFTILAPNNTYDNPNDSSIALILKNGDNSFLFTGDCEEQAETDILANGLSINCDVYKIGHHGSKTSSSQAFLNTITPVYGVISCEEGNSYGHPHAEPLNNLRAMGVQMFRTDEQGSIIAYSDGTKITWNCAPSDTWKAGEVTETSTESIPVTESIPQPTTEPEPEPQPEISTNGSYAVNGNNGKIHMVGECSATGTGKNAMKNPVYFDTYEEAETYSISIAPGEDKRKCGNCW